MCDWRLDMCERNSTWRFRLCYFHVRHQDIDKQFCELSGGENSYDDSYFLLYVLKKIGKKGREKKYAQRTLELTHKHDRVYPELNTAACRCILLWSIYRADSDTNMASHQRSSNSYVSISRVKLANQGRHVHTHRSHTHTHKTHWHFKYPLKHSDTRSAMQNWSFHRCLDKVKKCRGRIVKLKISPLSRRRIAEYFALCSMPNRQVAVLSPAFK